MRSRTAALAVIPLLLLSLGAGPSSARTHSQDPSGQEDLEAEAEVVSENAANAAGWAVLGTARETARDSLGLRAQGYVVEEVVLETSEGFVYAGAAAPAVSADGPPAASAATAEVANDLTSPSASFSCTYWLRVGTVRYTSGTTVTGQISAKIGSTCPGGSTDVWAYMWKDDGLFGDQRLNSPGAQMSVPHTGSTRYMNVFGTCGGSGNEYYTNSDYGTAAGQSNDEGKLGPRSVINC